MHTSGVILVLIGVVLAFLDQAGIAPLGTKWNAIPAFSVIVGLVLLLIDSFAREIKGQAVNWNGKNGNGEE